MEYLVPLLIIVVVTLVALVAGVMINRAIKRNGARNVSQDGQEARSGRAKKPSRRGLAGRISAEAAAEASERMDEETHREVYRRIAAGRATEAAMIYRNATGLGAMDSMFDVQALAAYPQEWSSEEDQPAASSNSTSEMDTDEVVVADEDRVPQPEPKPNEAIESSGATELTDLTVPTAWEEEAAAPEQPFHVEVVRPEGTVQLSSDDLPAWLKDQLAAMVRDERIEEAATMMAEHTLLTDHESLDLLRIIAKEQGGNSGE